MRSNEISFPLRRGRRGKKFLRHNRVAVLRTHRDVVRHSNATRLRGLRPGCSGTQACHAVLELELAHPRPGTRTPETEESLLEIVIYQILVLKAPVVLLDVFSKLTTILISNYTRLVATFFLP